MKEDGSFELRAPSSEFQASSFHFFYKVSGAVGCDFDFLAGRKTRQMLHSTFYILRIMY